MNKRAWSTAVALAALVSAMGCGGDEGTVTPGQTTGGFGGASGFGGATAGTGAGGTTAAAPIPCGTMMCSAPAIPGGMMIPGLTLRPACCAAAATSTCGTLNGAVCEMPLPAAPGCPPGPSLGGFKLTACCIVASQLCGIDASMVGMGCTMLPAMFGGAAQQTKCDGTPVAPTATAGAPAVGGAGGAAGGTGGATAGAGGASGSAGGAAGGTGGAAAGASGAAAGASGAAAGRGGVGGAATAGRGGA